MNLLSRMSFWSSLAGLCAALIAPMILGGASFGEALVAVVAGLLLTLASAVTSFATLPSRSDDGREDAVLRRAKGRADGITRGLVAAVVLATLGAVLYGRAERVRDAAVDPSATSWEQTYQLDVATDATSGMTSGVLAMVGAGLALASVIMLRARGPVAPPPTSGHYDPHAHVRAAYGPRPAPMPVRRISVDWEPIDWRAPTVPMERVGFAERRG